MKIEKFILIIAPIMIFCMTMGTMVPFSFNIANRISLVATDIVYPVKVLIDVHNTTKNITKEKDVPCSPAKEEKNDEFWTLFYFLGAILLTNKSSVLLLMFLSAIFSMKFAEVTAKYTEPAVYSLMKWLLLKILEFLTPLQKCMLTILYNYDLTSILSKYTKELKPAFLNYQECGFFLLEIENQHCLGCSYEY